MKTKTIHHAVSVQATPKEVYDALMNSKRHAKFTGARANINQKVGGAFSCYDGYITGINLELDSGKRIIQAWRATNWPKGTYSMVTFKLSQAGKGKTKLEFTQVGVPADDYEDKNQGWKQHYWKPLKAMLEK